MLIRLKMLICKCGWSYVNEHISMISVKSFFSLLAINSLVVQT